MKPAQARGLVQAGFTLVEVLVALALMAILAGFAWQGLDGVLRAREHNREAMERSVRLGTVLLQWEQDLLALHDTASAVPALGFDGQVLRLTRRVDDGAGGGVALVAWSVRGGVWQRWVSPAYVRVGDLQQAWLRSQQFTGSEPGHLLLAQDASEWQLYYFRGDDNTWSNAQSSGGRALPPGAPPAVTLPLAVRLVITLGGAKLTRDIALGPSA
jgi:general secretion pathway protein J